MGWGMPGRHRSDIRSDERFCVGGRWVEPDANEIDGKRVDGKSIDVLIELAEAAPGVLSVAALLERKSRFLSHFGIF